jgi:hypothetical protein
MSRQHPEANLAASTTSNSSNVPASLLHHVERSQLVDGNPIKATDFSQPEWEIPTPTNSVIDPEADLPNIRTRLMREGSDSDKLLRLRQHREHLEALDPVL